LSEIAHRKGLTNTEESLSLCHECKLGLFSKRLLGSDFKKVSRMKPLPSRRSEKLEPIKYDTRLGTTVYKTECFSCNQGCDAVVHVKEDRMVKVEGDVSSHVTRGVLCSKGLASTGHLYHKERVLYPLKHEGKRGDGGWKQISWDEALDTIVIQTKRFVGDAAVSIWVPVRCHAI
jgi:anaerobic selenocysteine-containing dehydrogenase